MPPVHPVNAAIRQALSILGLEAAVEELRNHILRVHPEMKNALLDKQFVQRVHASRHSMRAAVKTEPAEGEVKRHPKARRTPTKFMDRVQALELADEFYTLAGANPQHAQKILAFLGAVDVEQLRKALKGWLGVVQSCDGIERARNVLKAMREAELPVG